MRTAAALLVLTSAACARMWRLPSWPASASVSPTTAALLVTFVTRRDGRIARMVEIEPARLAGGLVVAGARHQPVGEGRELGGRRAPS